MAPQGWQQAATVLAGMGAGWLLALAAEQLAASAWHRGLRRFQPLLDEPASARYDRSVFTPGALELQIVHGLIGLAGVGLWLGLARHPGLHAMAAAAWLAALVLDVWSSQSVEVNERHVAWRRGTPLPGDGESPGRLGRQPPVRRLPLAQVAAVHVVERPGDSRWAHLAQRVGLRPGTAYLALAFHNGRAVKLPRTSRRFGLPAVQRTAGWIEQHQWREAEARRQAAAAEAHAQARATRVVADTLAPVDDLEPAPWLAPAASAVILDQPLPLATRVDDDAVIEVQATVVSKTGP